MRIKLMTAEGLPPSSLISIAGHDVMLTVTGAGEVLLARIAARMRISSVANITLS
jgi:hypothetical protein